LQCAPAPARLQQHRPQHLQVGHRVPRTTKRNSAIRPNTKNVDTKFAKSTALKVSVCLVSTQANRGSCNAGLGAIDEILNVGCPGSAVASFGLRWGHLCDCVFAQPGRITSPRLGPTGANRISTFGATSRPVQRLLGTAGATGQSQGVPGLTQVD
jgi:hypothetical protein